MSRRKQLVVDKPRSAAAAAHARLLVEEAWRAGKHEHLKGLDDGKCPSVGNQPRDAHLLRLPLAELSRV